MWSRLRRQAEEAGGIAEDLYVLTDDAYQLHGLPPNSGWFDGARNGSQLHEFTDAVVGPALQWYMEYECRDFANNPQGRAVVLIDKMIRADSAGFFCEGVHLAASDDYYSYWPGLSCGLETFTFFICAYQLLLQQFPEPRIGLRNVGEALTVCRCLDFLMAGQLAQLGDTLRQRLKALGASFRCASWAAAKHANLLPAHVATLPVLRNTSEATGGEKRVPS